MKTLKVVLIERLSFRLNKHEVTNICIKGVGAIRICIQKGSLNFPDIFSATILKSFADSHTLREPTSRVRYVLFTYYIVFL